MLAAGLVLQRAPALLDRARCAASRRGASLDGEGRRDMLLGAAHDCRGRPGRSSMRRAASLTASKEEMQLFWTVRDWDLHRDSEG